MADYAPTTDQVRTAYRNALARFLTPIDLTDFDAWLASVQADAWDEGVAAQCATYGMTPDTGPNPYRPKETP